MPKKKQTEQKTSVTNKAKTAKAAKPSKPKEAAAPNKPKEAVASKPKAATKKPAAPKPVTPAEAPTVKQGYTMPTQPAKPTPDFISHIKPMKTVQCSCGRRTQVEPAAVSYYCSRCEVAKMIGQDEIDFIDDYQRSMFSEGK